MVLPVRIQADDLPWLTTDQMREVDRLMIEVYGIELIQMMENAGRALAHLARSHFLDGDPRGRRVIVLAGKGGNGGGALVAARRLHNYGARVEVLLASPPDALTPVPAHQQRILTQMNVPIHAAAARDILEPSDLILDGLIGYSLAGAPRGESAALIRWANQRPEPVLSLDAPSGVDTTTGTPFDPAIRAAATLTLALPKIGLRAPAVRPHTGPLFLADISVPPALYARLSLPPTPIFATHDIIQIV